jgi:hypothetical protein
MPIYRFAAERLALRGRVKSHRTTDDLSRHSMLLTGEILLINSLRNLSGSSVLVKIVYLLERRHRPKRATQWLLRDNLSTTGSPLMAE